MAWSVWVFEHDPDGIFHFVDRSRFRDFERALRSALRWSASGFPLVALTCDRLLLLLLPGGLLSVAYFR